MAYKIISSLALILLLGVLLYFVKPEIFSARAPSITSEQTADDPLSDLSINTFEEMGAGLDAFDVKKNLFIVGETEIQGEKYVRFAANIWKDDGEHFEACILYGDGEENCIAHWNPQLFSEQESHKYKQPGTYTARLVLVPKSSLTPEVLRFERNVADLTDLIEVKSITFVLDESGKVFVEDAVF